jgi:hypothetical protein
MSQCTTKDCKNNKAICSECFGGDAYYCIDHSSIIFRIQNETICDKCLDKVTCDVCTKHSRLGIKCTYCHKREKRCLRHTMYTINKLDAYCSDCINRRVCSKCFKPIYTCYCNRSIFYKCWRFFIDLFPHTPKISEPKLSSEQIKHLGF